MNNTPMYCLISFAAGHYVSKFDILSTNNNALISKIRHTIDAKTNTAYIEAYYESGLINPLSFTTLCCVDGYGNIGVWKFADAQPTQESVPDVSVMSIINL